MEVGLVGLPNSGKTTLFNALTKAGAPVASYPFTTIDQNVGVVTVPDERLDRIAALLRPERRTPTTIRFVDIAGLVRGASRGEGLGNQFLGHIRNTDAVAHIVRCFTKSDVAHVAGAVDPSADIETINTELCLADLATVESRLDKLARQAKCGDKAVVGQTHELQDLGEKLGRGLPARSSAVAVRWVELSLLTAKPTIYVANVDEQDIGRPDNPMVSAVREAAERDGAPPVVVSAKVEAELAELPEAEAAGFRDDLGLAESGLSQLVKVAYDLLGLITFFTVVGPECRAWTVSKGATAVRAAEKVHTDMAKGFVKAEVVHYGDLLADGSLAAAREHGHLRLEGRDYVVEDGDVLTFKFT